MNEQEKWFTFLIKLDLNKRPNQHRGQNWWNFVVYRCGKDFEEAWNKINVDFGEMILFAIEGKLHPLRGELLTNKDSFCEGSPYNLILER